MSARLRSLRLGATVSMGRLDVTPLIVPEDGAREYRLLHESLADLLIEEVATGQVNRISALNRGEQPVLILEGQTVTGAKQNRMVASTVLVAAQSMVELDVGCVEHGRWSPRGGAFTLGTTSVAPTMRARTVKEAKYAGKVNQARLWGDVAFLMSAHEVHSPTPDYVTLLEKQRREVEERARALEPQPGQVGTIVLERGRLVALELLGHADAWRAMAQRLVASYLLEAEVLERGTSRGHGGRGGEGRARGDAGARGTEPAPPPASAADWFASLLGARTTLHSAAGLGTRIALDGRGPGNETLHGAGLWFGGRPVHLAAFAVEN